MWLLAISIVVASLVAAALYRATRQSRLYQSLGDGPCLSGHDLPPLAVIVPVRNEVDNIGRCLTALLGQDYPHDRLQIVVVDDGSTDGSQAVVRRMMGEERPFGLIEAGPLPDGWVGKSHACWQGVHSVDADWLLFCDADTTFNPGFLHAAMAAVIQGRFDMVSLEPFQELTFFLDRLVMPIGFLAIAATQDLGRIGAAGTPDATANGQVLFFRARSYVAIGGHASVCREICEDAALARRIKAAGLRFALIGAESLARVRMYKRARDLWEGLSKNVTEVYGGPAATIAIACALVVIAWAALLLPAATIVAAIRDARTLQIVAALVALSTAAAVFATTVSLACHFRIPWWYGLLFPVGALVGAAIALDGVRHRVRRRTTWKGRVYGDGRSGVLS